MSSFVALLLAYMNGNGNLCRALVRAHACIGSCNRQGINIFNTQVATTQLLRRLLGKIDFIECYSVSLTFVLDNNLLPNFAELR